MQPEKLPWELEEKILSLTPAKSLTRFRSVCKRWNALINNNCFVNDHLARVRPHFILLAKSKFCLVDVKLDGPSIEVHNLPQYIPGYNGVQHPMIRTLEYCDGLLMFPTTKGIGICNPWLRQIKWMKSITNCRFNGIGYDNSRPDNHYKIFQTYILNESNTMWQVKTTEFESDANEWKTYKFAMDYIMSSVSLNGNLYWIASNRVSAEQFIQSFIFSTERFEFYCNLPNKITNVNDARSLQVYREDRFSYLEQNYETRNIEIWVTKKKIKHTDGEAVEWTKLMNMSVPEWSSLKVTSLHPPSYFIDEEYLSLVLCCYDKVSEACIYIAKRNKFHEIKINDLVENIHPPHCTYFPNLVQVPKFKMSGKGHVESCFAQTRNGVGGNEWDDGFFDRVKKIYVGQNDSGGVFIKFDYIKDNATVAGVGHGNATTHIPQYNELMIDDDDYIEAVEGTYTESQITSIAFRLHRRNWTIHGGLFNGMSFVLRGERDSKIIGFYGRSSGDQLTGLGVHFSAPG